MSSWKKKFFAKIDSRAEALIVIDKTSKGFFILAALMTLLSFLVGFAILFDAVCYLIGAFFLRQFKSRVAATFLLVLAFLSVGITIANLFGQNLGGGSNMAIALFIFWAAFRAVEATYKLHGNHLPMVSQSQSRSLPTW